MRKYSCDCQECLRLTFLSCVKNKWNIIENKSNNTDDSEGCLLDKENDPIKISEFVTIALFAAVTSCNTSEPVYFVKIVEKNVARESLRDRFGSVKYSQENPI